MEQVASAMSVSTGGTMRFAEFFALDDGHIRSLSLLYDAGEYRQLGGR